MKSNVVLFNQLASEQQSQAGGKGGTLAILSQAGYPIPDGFVILPGAFDGDDLKTQAWKKVRDYLIQFREKREDIAFAVRSSALAEDSANASFAGEFETILNVSTDDDISAAINTVRRSRKSERVQSYSHAKGMDTVHEISVVVQQMVPSEISGVLFTADPVTGSRAKMTGNFVFGLGDKLVSGEVDAHHFEFQHPRGKYSGPDHLKRYSRKLYRLVAELEDDLGMPQDIEWAISGGKLYVLQSRPITTLIGHNAATGEWNDTLTGDYLWSNVNFGEAVTEPMTPLAWTVLQFTLDEWIFLPGFSTTGNIGGNPYLNISIFASLFNAIGRSQADLLKFLEGTLYMPLPENMKIPLIPLTPRLVFAGLKNLLRVQNEQRKGIKYLPVYLKSNQPWFLQMKNKLQIEDSKSGLLHLWRIEIAPHIKQGVWTVLGTATHSSDYTMKLRRTLTKLVGPEDANLLIANVSDAADLLPSLGPVVGLAKVAAGEISRDDYLEKFGHRGPHEFEISKPRPIEDPDWIEQQLAQFRTSPMNMDSMLVKQRESFNAAWARFVARYPQKSKSMHRQLAENACRTRLREQARSAYIRDRWLVRLFSIRAGELLGIGEDVFYLFLSEVFVALNGDERSLARIADRKATHQRNLELPAFPSVIRGRFDPSQWANDPHRRSDIFDAQMPLAMTMPDPKQGLVSGSPGSAGRVDGIVRVLKNPQDGDQLQSGEILVTTQTDISWTVIFPRAAAVITDIGAPLSHAAIVARELGIPAVVGCGDATMRLKTGDHVSVDGGQGYVQIR